MAEEKILVTNHSAQRRKQLLRATCAVIARRGLSGITVNEIAEEAGCSYIAEEAGCSYGVIAFHFGTKERLLLAALDTVASDYEAVWSSAMATASSSPAERLRVLLQIDFDPRVAKASQLAVWMAFWDEAPRVPAYKRRCNELKRRSLQSVTELVSELAHQRGMDIDIESVSQGLYALTDGCWVFGHVTGRNGPRDRERYRQVCLTFLRAVFPDDF